MKLKQIVKISIILMLFAPMIVTAAIGNDSLTPSAQRGSKLLPQSAKDSVGDIVDLAMYVAAIIAILAAIFAAAIAFFSKDQNKRNMGITWLGYIIFISLLLGIVFAIINAFLFT